MRDLEQAALLDDPVQGLAVQALCDLLGLLQDLLPEPLLGEVADTRRLQPLPEILHVLRLEHHPGARLADCLQHLQKQREVGNDLHWMRENCSSLDERIVLPDDTVFLPDDTIVLSDDTIALPDDTMVISPE